MCQAVHWAQGVCFRRRLSLPPQAPPLPFTMPPAPAHKSIFEQNKTKGFNPVSFSGFPLYKRFTLKFNQGQ